MSNSRRSFLQTTAGLAAGIAGAAAARGADAPANIQVPRVKFGNAEISRLVAGSNHFYGYSHFNRALDALIREWHTPERVCAALHSSEQNGINAYQYVHHEIRNYPDLQRFRTEGGRMHLLALAVDQDPEQVVRTIKPLALLYHGERTDKAFQNGRMAEVREYTKKVRQTGALVGVSTHKPEVIQTIEEEGWDVDCYFACAYNRTRTREELSKILSEIPVPSNEIYLPGDPARMFKVVRQTKRTCFVFKILAAGRLSNSPEAVDQAFRTTFESIKPYDCIMVGMSQRFKDEVRENAERTQRILSQS